MSTAVAANGSSSNSAAGHGRTEAVRELIKLQAVAPAIMALHYITQPLMDMWSAVAMLEEGCPLDEVECHCPGFCNCRWEC